MREENSTKYQNFFLLISLTFKIQYSGEKKSHSKF